MAEDYAKRLQETASQTFSGFMFALAQDAGIIDVLLKANGPVTSCEIAAQKGLKERYVREILGNLCAGSFVRVATDEQGQNVYHLTPGDKAAMEDPNNCSMLTMIAAVAKKFDVLRSCLDAAGPYGFHYDSDFYDAMEGFSKGSYAGFVKGIFTNCAGLKDRLETGIEVADFGCGRGYLIAKLAENYPNSSFTAIEYLPVKVERLKSTIGHLPNLKIEQHDLEKLGDDMKDRFDWVMENQVVHDLAKPQLALQNLHKCTKKNGGVCTLIEPTATETGNPEEAVGDEIAGLYYALGTIACIPEGFTDDSCATMGAVFGKKKIKDMAVKAGFEVALWPVSSGISVHVCTPL